MIQAVIQFIQDGGVFMYPILFIGFLGLAIIIERGIYLFMVKQQNQAFWQRIYPSLGKEELQQTLSKTKASPCAMARVIHQGLKAIQQRRSTEDMSLAMEETLMEILPRLEARTHYVATFANIATLLGLLGTIIGLITAFGAVSNADPAQKAEMLSAAISVAMNTTALGLFVAIPLMLAHALLTSLTDKVVDSLDIASMKCLNRYRTALANTKA